MGMTDIWAIYLDIALIIEVPFYFGATDMWVHENAQT